MKNIRDVFADTWVGIDALGRPTDTNHRPPRERKVGIFYFLWHDRSFDQPIYDHSAAWTAGGCEALKKVMTEGPLGFAHYWAEPYFGYYRSDDDWIIRRHTLQLNAAGVDFIFIDATNGLTYPAVYEKILAIWSEMRAQGIPTPQIMFNCGDTDDLARSSVKEVWENLYSKGRYRELWFTFKGKPVILAPASLWKTLPDEIQNFFTCRQCWAYTRPEAPWYAAVEGKNCWPWGDLHPQGPGLSADGELEQMIVMCGFWANGCYGIQCGRSFHAGRQPDNLTDEDFGYSLAETTGQGLGFAEQLSYATEQDPPLMMITGWNEWWAGRWEGGPAVGCKIANTYTVTADDPFSKNYYVDTFNPEFSRDIEPVKGFFNDNYYYQMAQGIRAYKGSRRAQSAFGQRSINLDGPLSQWNAVGPEYRDYTGDTTHRDFPSFVGRLRYINNSGRNDLELCKVSRIGDEIAFYVRCANLITPAEGSNWMNLFLNTDGRPDTGWQGFNVVLNRSREGNSCSIMRFVDNSWAMEEIGRAEMRLNGNVLVIKTSAALLGLGDSFSFKWADNSVDDGDVMQFIDRGDTAPDGRFTYHFTTLPIEPNLPDLLTEDMTVLKTGSYNAFVGRKMVMLNSADTGVVFRVEGEKWILPDTFPVKTEGKIISCGESVVVIADRALNQDELLTLQRALY